VQRGDTGDDGKRAIGNARNSQPGDGTSDDQHLGGSGHTADQRSDFEDSEEANIRPLNCVSQAQRDDPKPPTLALKFS
jgi:hypothetical protein